MDATRFIDRERDLAALEHFWASGRAECIPVTGRRRVGKTCLLEHFAAGKRVVYYRCELKPSSEQLPQLGAALAELSADPILMAQPPGSWPALFATIERLARADRLLLILDELPYWVARDETVPSILQNWWDASGRTRDLVLVLCGSAVQMMERLLSGPAPLAGCTTGRLAVRPFDFRAAADLLGFDDPVDSLTAYGILGGVPLYLSRFRADRSLKENIGEAITSPSARLYVEPQALFAAHHESYDAALAMRILRAISRGNHRWSAIADVVGLTPAQLGRSLERLIGDLGMVERVLPVTETHETRGYFTQYHLTDNFFRFWFQFVEPNQGSIEFGDAEAVVASIRSRLPAYMGLPFEAICRDWARLASAAGVLPKRLSRVGSWWNENHQIDVVGLDESGAAAVVGEAKWQSAFFDWGQLERFLDHVRALGKRVRPDVFHVIFSKSGFTDPVVRWSETVSARLLTPADLLDPWPASTVRLNSADGAQR